MSENKSTDLVAELRAEVLVPYKHGYEPMRAPPSELMLRAAEEIEHLRKVVEAACLVAGSTVNAHAIWALRLRCDELTEWRRSRERS